MSADTASWYLNAANGYLSRFDNTKPPPVTMPLQPGGPCLLASDRFSVLRNGVWFVDRNGNNQWDAVDASRLMFFGLPGDQAVAGDWTANGVTRAGVFRNGLWYLDLNNNGLWDGPAGGDAIFSFGLPGDTAIVGDWNGDGRTKLGVFRCPPAGVCTWVLDYAGKFAYDPGTAKVLSYGLRGDIPVANNWSGTWIADQIGVYRPLPNGLALWIVDSNGSGAWEPSDAVYQFGLATDVPVVGNWNNGTRKRLGVFRNGTWIMDTNGNNAYDATDSVGFFGLPGDEPLASRWSASALNPPAQLAPADQSDIQQLSADYRLSVDDGFRCGRLRNRSGLLPLLRTEPVVFGRGWRNAHQRRTDNIIHHELLRRSTGTMAGLGYRCERRSKQ